MQYKIDATLEQIQDLKTHVFADHTYEIKNKQLIIDTGDDDWRLTVALFSTIKDFLKRPVSIDYMTQDIIKFVIL